MGLNKSGPTSTARGEAPDVDQLTGSITFKDTKSAPQSQAKFAPAVTRAEFAEHRGNRVSLSAMQRHRPHGVRAAGHRASPSTKAAAPNWRDQLDLNPLNWRAHLAVHPVAEAFPLLSEQELLELAGDIKRNGLNVDITLWRPDDKTTPVLLDGRNRMDALALIGRLALNGASELCIKGFDDSLLHVTSSPRFPIITGGDPETYVYSLNVHRRHLTPEKKRELIAAQIKADPSKSDLQIAKTVKASPTTVGTVRAKMEAKGDVSKLETRTDTKGRKQPAKKKTARKQSAKKKTAKPKRSASQDQRELEAKQAHIDDLEAAREHDQDLAEQLQAAKIKIYALEGEVEDLKAENAKLREQLEAAQKVAA